MKKTIVITIALSAMVPASAQHPFDAVRRSGVATGYELSDAFYHAGKNRLFAVDDGSPNDARIVTIDMAFTSTTNPAIDPIYTRDLTSVPPERQVDLEGITFK